MKLSELIDKTRHRKNVQRVGRGPGSGRGKTSSRGHKGDKSRSGYKRREGKEGGQLPLYQKLPTRGFSNVQFEKKMFTLNLDRINDLFEDGETLNVESLVAKGFQLRKAKDGIKILGNGELTKKITIEAHGFTKGAIKKLEEKSIEFKLIK